MSTGHHNEVEPATKPDLKVTKFLIAWTFAIGIGFAFANLIPVGVGVVWLIFVMTVTLGIMGIIGKAYSWVLATLLVIASAGMAVLGGQMAGINGPTAFGFGLLGVVGLGLTLQSALFGRFGFNITILWAAMSTFLPFALNGLRAFETNGVVGLF